MLKVGRMDKERLARRPLGDAGSMAWIMRVAGEIKLLGEV